MSKKRKNYFLVMTLSIAAAFGFQTASAQITINIPKLPKIKKLKIEQPTTSDGQTTQTQPAKPSSDIEVDNDGSSQNQSTKQPTRDEPTLINFFVSEINEAKKSVDEYSPEEKIYFVNAVGSEWLLRAVSRKARAEWAKDKTEYRDWLPANPGNKFDAALDALAASAAKKLPAYKANLTDFKFHNPAEEKMMRGVLTRIASYKIYSIGLEGNSWLIDKNDLGIPTARYKHGAVYMKDTTDDHPYCYLTYINVIQDYAGGGTYAASYAQFIRDELVGCPAATK